MVGSWVVIGTPISTVSKVKHSQLLALSTTALEASVLRFGQMAALGTDVSPRPIGRHWPELIA